MSHFGGEQPANRSLSKILSTTPIYDTRKHAPVGVSLVIRLFCRCQDSLKWSMSRRTTGMMTGPLQFLFSEPSLRWCFPCRLMSPLTLFARGYYQGSILVVKEQRRKYLTPMCPRIDGLAHRKKNMARTLMIHMFSSWLICYLNTSVLIYTLYSHFPF